MNFNQVIVCLSIGVLSFGMTEKSFATSADKEVEAAKQGKVVTQEIGYNLIQEMKDRELIIPAEYSTIEPNALMYNKDIKKIDFKNVQTIGDRAFVECQELTRIDFGNVQTIGQHAFTGCPQLTNIKFGNVQTIGRGAFAGCTNLGLITISNSVTTIGTGAFSECYNLKSINVYSKKVKQLILESNSGIDENIIHIVAEGNHNETSTISDGDIPSKISNKEVEATKQDQLLTFFVAHDLIKGMKDGGLVIPEEYIMINSYAFFLESNIRTIDFKNVKSIDKHAFSGCTGLTNIDFGNVETIGKGAFQECTKLRSITFSDKVTSIDEGAFLKCTGLTNINFGNVQTIGAGAFFGCKDLTSITIPNSVTSIGDVAFCNCTGLTNIDLGSNVKTIGIGAFARTYLKSITIPDSVTSIGEDAFTECKNLMAINVYSERVKQLILKSSSNISEHIIYVINENQQSPNELTAKEKYEAQLERIKYLRDAIIQEKGGEEFFDLAEVEEFDLHLSNDEIYFRQLNDLEAKLVRQLQKNNK